MNEREFGQNQYLARLLNHETGEYMTFSAKNEQRAVDKALEFYRNSVHNPMNCKVSIETWDISYKKTGTIPVVA